MKKRWRQLIMRRKMNAVSRTLFVLMILILPVDAIADISGSLSIGYQRVQKIRPTAWIFTESIPHLQYDEDNCWGTLNADMGYNFGRLGVFLAITRVNAEMRQFGIEPSNISSIVRTSFTFSGKAVIIGNPESARMLLEGGPSLDLQYAKPSKNSDMVFEKKKSLGVIFGVGFVIPPQFSNLLLRVRYTQSDDYKEFNTSGISADIGVGFD